jgi:hypothetical protein
MEDFRRADPTYVNFVPKTCMDAVDLFNRHRTLGLTPALYPECFVHCARRLTGPELDNFHRFIVNPSGDITKGGEKPSPTDMEIENERLQLEKECDIREMKDLTIEEEDEKCPNEESADYIKISPR